MLRMMFVFLMMINCAFAQAPAEMLDEKLNKTHTLSANFTQETLNAKTNSPRLTGKIVIQRPGKFRWEVAAPENN